MHAHVSRGHRPGRAVAVAETELPGPPNPRGEALVAELKWVHDMIRRDLRTVRQMAADVAAGLAAEEIQAGIRSLAAGGPLWQLKINCLQYCRFVHSHHHAVSDLLDEVGAAASELGSQEQPAVRQRLTRALQNLSTDLLAHLEYEEENISGTLRTLSGWPGW